jgi:hypothetical protein
MRKLLLPLAMIFALCLGPSTFAQQTNGPAGKAGPHLSGFYDFWSFPADSPSGVGTIQQITCTVGSSDQPAIYSGNMLLDCDAETPHNETTITVDPNDPKHAIGGYHSYQLNFNGSTLVERVVAAASVTFDGGQNWREIIPNVAPYQFNGDPGLAFDANSRIYYTTLADHEGPGGSFTGPSIVVTHSDDGGLTWSRLVTIARGQTAITPKQKGFGPNLFNDKPFLGVDTFPASPFKNRVYVTWTPFSQFFSPTAASFHASIAVSFSDDGANWSAPKTISGFSPACSAALFGLPNECDLDQDSYPAVAPAGRVYVSFENFNTPAENQALIVSSADGGQTWSEPVKVATLFDINYPLNSDGRSTLTGCTFRYGVKANTATDPSDPTGRTVYVVWADNRHGTVKATNTDVFLGKSTDGGATWTTIPVDTSANDQFYPWVEVAPDGTVHVGYMDRAYSSGQNVCEYGFSVTTLDTTGTVVKKQRVDSGLSDPGHSRWFSKSTNPQSRFLGDYNGLAIGSDGSIWSLWTDSRDVVANPPSPLRNHGQHAVASKN